MRARKELRDLNERLEGEVKKRSEELSAAYERLHLSEKLSSLGQLTAGIAHELNNPLAYVLSNVELIRERLSSREVLRRIRRIRGLLRAAAGEGTRVTLEETFLSALEDFTGFARDVADYRADVEELTGEVRRDRFLEFLTWLEGAAASRGGADRDLYSGAVRLLDSAEDGLHRVREIVRDLSAFSHPGSEEPGPVDLSAAAERVLTILTPALKEREVRVASSLKLREPVVGVGGKIDQVLMNILLNAVQASPRGGTIRIRSRRDGAHGRLEIEDEGPGIPPEHRSRIFDPFFTTKPVGEGTGLGLAICYRIVEGLSGDIGFRCRRSRGTVFTVRLPLRRASPDEGKEAPS
jgi:signal transduction histidine kinase